MESTCLIPPSAALGRHFIGMGDRWKSAGVGEDGGGVSRRGHGVAVPVALNRRGTVDVHLRASALSDSDRRGGSDVTALEESALRPRATESPALITPWRLMGTIPIDEIWPSCLAEQSWGAATVLRAENDGVILGVGAKVWRGFLEGLMERNMAAVMALPRDLFGTVSPGLSCGDPQQEGDVSRALAVALLVPVSRGCAVGFSVGGSGADVGDNAGEVSRTEALLQPAAAVSRHAGLARHAAQASVEDSSSVEQSQLPGGACPLTAGVCDGKRRSELMLQRRGAEVDLAMQEASLARRRRRQGRIISGQGVRAMRGAGSSIAGAVERGAEASGVHSASLSPRDSGSLSFTAEGTSGDRVACNARQWRLEMASEASNDSGSLRGYRLFDTPAGGTEDDDRTSSTESSSGPRRALQQALEDLSSRSSLPGADADSSSSPKAGEGKGESAWVAGAVGHRLVDVDAGSVGGGSRRQGGVTFLTTGEADEEAAVFSEEVDSAPAQLPLSFMPEPALACLPGASLPAELVALAERCARSNQASAAASDTAAAARRSRDRMRSPMNPSVKAPGSLASPPRVRARRRFIDAVRALEGGVPAGCPDTGPRAAKDAFAGDGIAPDAGGRVETEVVGEQPPSEGTQHGKEACSVGADGGGKSGGVSGFGDRVREGIAGLLRQYHEVVASGQRSPVDFVVRAVPQVSRGARLGLPSSLAMHVQFCVPGRHERPRPYSVVAISPGSL